MEERRPWAAPPAPWPAPTVNGRKIKPRERPSWPPRPVLPYQMRLREKSVSSVLDAADADAKAYLALQGDLEEGLPRQQERGPGQSAGRAPVAAMAVRPDVPDTSPSSSEHLVRVLPEMQPEHSVETDREGRDPAGRCGAGGPSLLC